MQRKNNTIRKHGFNKEIKNTGNGIYIGKYVTFFFNLNFFRTQLKSLNYKTFERLCDLRLDKDFLGRAPKALFTERQIDTFDFIKIKLFRCRKQAYDNQGAAEGVG